MKKAPSIISIIIVFLSSISFCDEITHQFETANDYYRKGEYEKALSIYEQILNNGYVSSDLYYNIGNTYHKLENIPAAILYYERAKKLSPSDEDIDFNLKLANLRVVDKIDPIPRFFIVEWWYSLSNIFNSEKWSIITIISSWLFVLSILVIRLINIPIIKNLFIPIIILSMISIIFTFLLSYTQYKYENDKTVAIVFSQNVSVKSSPDEAGTDLFVIHEGVKVKILDSLNEWIKIKLADGKVGWIPFDSIQII